MPRLVVDKFTAAHDAILRRAPNAVDVLDGEVWPDRIEALRSNRKVQAGAAKALYVNSGRVVAEQNECYVYAEGPPVCGGLVFRSGGGVPRVARLTEAAQGQWLRLSVPQPATPPTLVNNDTPNATDETALEYTTAVYTYVTQYGWESGPSLPSQPIAVSHGNQLTISGMVLPPMDAGVTQMRVYLFHAGPKTAKPNGIIGTYALAASLRPATQATVTFGRPGEGLTTIGYEPAPDNLTMLRTSRTGHMIGLAGNVLAISSMNVPWSWPSAQRMVFYDRPIALALTYSRAYVLTDERPFIVDMSKGTCQGADCFPAQHAPVAMPCIAWRSVATVADAVIFCGRDGIVMLDGLQERIIGFATKEAYWDTDPHTAIGVCDGRRYFYFTARGSWMIDLTRNNLTRLSEKDVQAACTDERGIVHIATKRGIEALNDGPGPRMAKIRLTVHEGEWLALARYSVRLDQAQHAVVRHEADKTKLPAHTVTSLEAVPLPLEQATTWHATIQTTGHLREYRAATGAHELWT